MFTVQEGEADSASLCMTPKPMDLILNSSRRLIRNEKFGLSQASMLGPEFPRVRCCLFSHTINAILSFRLTVMHLPPFSNNSRSTCREFSKRTRQRAARYDKVGKAESLWPIRSMLNTREKRQGSHSERFFVYPCISFIRHAMYCHMLSRPFPTILN